MVQNNGHDMLPPDFFSDSINIMFDVTRVNDSEIKKGYNPVLIRENESIKRINEIQQFTDPKINVHVVNNQMDNSPNYDKYHKLLFYQRQCSRVIKKHIEKIPIWEKNHPEITRKGLVICDEAGLYIKGSAVPVGYTDFGELVWGLRYAYNAEIHCPWLDIEHITILKESSLDFAAWYMPYKRDSIVGKHLKNRYPKLVILDLKTIDKGIPYQNPDDWVAFS